MLTIDEPSDGDCEEFDPTTWSAPITKRTTENSSLALEDKPVPNRQLGIATDQPNLRNRSMLHRVFSICFRLLISLRLIALGSS